MDLESGQVIAERYRLGEQLGAGGFGEVWSAERVDIGDKVALKMLNQTAASDDTAVNRFLREMQAPAQIGHPAIARVLDSGVYAKRPFLVMELLEGRSFRDVFADPHTSVPRRLQLMEAVLEPLIAAHQRGFVHRDLKPENLFETTSGSVKLLDFGLARNQSEDSNLTATGTALGTAYYMSPEQARSAKSAGPPADVWAMGVMLQEATTGQRPFGGETAADVIVNVCTKPPPKLTPNEHVSASMIELIEWCLEKDPKRRLQDAASLHSALAVARRGESPRSSLGETMLPDGVGAVGSTVGAPSTSEPIPVIAGRRPKWILWALPLAFLLSAGGAWVAASVLLGGGDEASPAEASQAPTSSPQAEPSAEPVPEGAELPTTAQVRVRSDLSNAMLYIDAIDRGPIQGDQTLELPPGAHRIEARRGNRIIAGETLDLEAGEAQELELQASGARHHRTRAPRVARSTAASEMTPSEVESPTTMARAEPAAPSPTPTPSRPPTAAPEQDSRSRAATRTEPTMTPASPFVTPTTVRPAPQAPVVQRPPPTMQTPVPTPSTGAPPSVAQMKAALDRVRAQVQACDPSYHGRVNVTVAFRPDGSVHAARIAARSQQRRCMQTAIVNGARVPAFSGRAARVRHGWDF